MYLTADMLNDLNGTVAIQIRGIQSKGTFEQLLYFYLLIENADFIVVL